MFTACSLQRAVTYRREQQQELHRHTLLQYDVAGLVFFFFGLYIICYVLCTLSTQVFHIANWQQAGYLIGIKS